MQGAAPDSTGQGQPELAGGYSLASRFDAGATYSPLPHLLARAAFSVKSSRRAPGDSSDNGRISQYEPGLCLCLSRWWQQQP